MDDPPFNVCTGLGGNPARVGVYDGNKFYALLGSCSSDILNITRFSNFDSNKAPGKFAFQLDKAVHLLEQSTSKLGSMQFTNN